MTYDNMFLNSNYHTEEAVDAIYDLRFEVTNYFFTIGLSLDSMTDSVGGRKIVVQSDSSAF